MFNKFFQKIILWKRVWIFLSVLFFVFAFMVYGFIKDEFLYVLMYSLVLTVFFSLFLFIVMCTAQWMMSAAEKETKKLIVYGFFWLIIVLGLVVIYYIASPYQNCIRKSLSASFCVRETGW
jgi:hypothetical protein